MILAFELSMPNVGSWNGKWSNADKKFVRTRSFKKDAPKTGNYYYNFGDGWGANVSVREVDSREAAKLKRASAGFNGYDWMIDSIVKYGKIGNNLHQAEWDEELAKAAS
jgi:hypothetical protein